MCPGMSNVTGRENREEEIDNNMSFFTEDEFCNDGEEPGMNLRAPQEFPGLSSALDDHPVILGNLRAVQYHVRQMREIWT